MLLPVVVRRGVGFLGLAVLVLLLGVGRGVSDAVGGESVGRRLQPGRGAVGVGDVLFARRAVSGVVRMDVDPGRGAIFVLVRTTGLGVRVNGGSSHGAKWGRRDGFVVVVVRLCLCVHGRKK